MDEEARYGDERAYEPPALTVLGAVEELTCALPSGAET